MIFASLLTTTGLIILTRASPVSLTTYRRRDVPIEEGQMDEESIDGLRLEPERLLLYDQKGFQVVDSSPKSLYDLSPDHYPRMWRPKLAELSNEVGQAPADKRGLRSNSLSIVNNMEVLRNQVLFELARRKALQNQRQAMENRKILESIGKRSIQENEFPQNPSRSPDNIKNRVYTDARSNSAQHQQHQTYTERIPVERTHEWYDIDDSLIRGNGDDETRKMVSNEIRLL
ncbi:diuretic hormone 44 [Venturia canescens]|uniref:diuretic hormone 44 n=1 Tax=Venturia canescens TaxID=32260 RepID=UPI001C9C7621|nr:diuretic hormone 44-like [Venturia canescens]XP_043270227.1 diuretic hormone 44-like [Venturia canescens]